MNALTPRTVAVLTVIASLLSLITSAHAQPGCGAVGHNDGSEATAAAWCLYGSDGVPLSPSLPLDCSEVSYQLVVPDDTLTAVFPTQVIQNYTPALPIGSESAGFDNHFGTVVDVLGVPSAPGAAPPHASAIGSAFHSELGDRLFSATGRWWTRYCWNAGETLGQLAGRADGPFGEGPVVPLEELVAGAMVRLAPPDPPPVLFAGPASILQLPTWFWIHAGWWNADHLEVARHGRVSVSVAAVPHLWRLSIDGLEVAMCDRRGIEFEARFRDDHPDACNFTFTEVPLRSQVQLEAEVEIGVWWTTSLEGYGTQRLPPFSARVQLIMRLSRWLVCVEPSMGVGPVQEPVEGSGLWWPKRPLTLRILHG